MVWLSCATEFRVVPRSLNHEQWEMWNFVQIWILQLMTNKVCMLLQSEDEDIEIAPEPNEQGFTFDQNVQMPSGGFQLWSSSGYL